MESPRYIESKEEKPKFLYHGSTNRSIDIFEPRISYGSGEKYGPKVYASPNRAAATIFLSDVGKTWSAGMYGNALVAVIPYSREEFMARDKGGAIYLLPGETFEHNEEEMGGEEWASSKPVKPLDVVQYPSALQAMLEAGVQVYFVNGEINKKITSSKDGGLSLLREMRSENQVRDYNVRPIG